MAVMHTYNCLACGKVAPDCWSDDVPECCGAEMSILYLKVNTNEWGGPRTYIHIRDEPFGSRSELDAYAKANHMALGESAEKVGGARNEEHLNLGKRYSYRGAPGS